MLTRVTITGADNGVDPKELAALSAEFPFVEWGILLSAKRQGTPRYPGPGWLGSLERLAFAGSVALSAHACGQIARRIMGGDKHFVLSALQMGYRRIQLNGFGLPCPELDRVAYVAASGRVELILQVQAEEHLQTTATFAAALPGSASILFDPSGGRGVEPFRWPPDPHGARMGFAGGINPENVEQVIGEIAVTRLGSEPWWIDMESGVRTDDRFDLAKVRAVLERAAPRVEARAC